LVNFSVCLFKLIDGQFVVLFCLSEIELKLSSLTLSLFIHVVFPVVDALLRPLLHESRVSLKFVDLDPTHLLLLKSAIFNVFSVKFMANFGLPIHFFGKLLKMELQVDFLL